MHGDTVTESGRTDLLYLFCLLLFPPAFKLTKNSALQFNRIKPPSTWPQNLEFGGKESKSIYEYKGNSILEREEKAKLPSESNTGNVKASGTKPQLQGFVQIWTYGKTFVRDWVRSASWEIRPSGKVSKVISSRHLELLLASGVKGKY